MLREDSTVSRAVLTALFAVLLVLVGCAAVKSFSGESVDLAVDHMLHAVGEAAKISSSRAKASDLEISEVAVTLETVAQRETSGELTLWVVTIDGSREKEFTQSVTVLLKPSTENPRSKSMTEGDITSPHPLIVKRLAKGFDAAYLAASGAKEGLRRADSGDAPLETSTVTVEISFTIIGSGSATPTVEILGVDLTGSHSRTRENVHKVKIVFEEKPTADGSSQKKGA